MSVSELKSLIIAKTTPVLGASTKATLRGILETAENEAILQSRSMVNDPVTSSPLSYQDILAMKRAELTAEALMGFFSTMQNDMANATATAVVTFLTAHQLATYVPGSLVLPTPSGPVPIVATAPISTIAY